MAGNRSRDRGEKADAEQRFEIGTAPAPDAPYALLIPEVRKVVGAAVSAPLWALPIASRLPPHPKLDALTALDVPGIVMPTARRVAHGADWVLWRGPAGTPASLLSGAIDEARLTSRILRPACAALEDLRRRGLTHRALRPSNIFIGGSSDQVELGPFWFAPPAHGQSAISETPWVAACLPEARGPGSIADDVYALGVLILGLCLGAMPLEGIAEEEVIDRKIRLGSYSALLADRRLPPSLGDLVSAMLADEPSQRPSPERLAQGASLAGPKSVSRKRVNAAVPLLLEETSIWTTPQLAYAIAITPDLVGQALLLGQVNHWLRRCLNEIVLAEKLESLVRPADGPSPLASDDPARVAAALLGISRLLDPSAPLIWRGVCLMPDGVGTLLASIDDRPAPERALVLSAIAGALSVQASRGGEDQRPAGIEASTRQIRNGLRTPLGLLHVIYEHIPALACRSKLVGGQAPVALAELLPAIEAEVATQAAGSSTAVFRLDDHLIAFVAARRRPSRPPPHAVLNPVEQLRMLAAIWQETRAAPLPHLAASLADEAMKAAAAWPGRQQQEARRAELRRVAQSGSLLRLVALIEDETVLEAALGRRDEAEIAISHLVRRRDALRAAGEARRSAARRFGREAVGVMGAALSAVTLLLQLLP